METKDIITITLSSLAFLLSLIATAVSIIRGRLEAQRAIKREIIDTLGKIVATNLESAKVYREYGVQDPAYCQSLSNILSQQYNFLVHQATYLADQVPGVVTAIEYNTIAMATAGIGDLVSAEKYYKKAIDVTPNNYYRSLAIRSYAGHLFQQRRFEEGRDNFRKAITLLTGGDSLVRYTNGLTYQTWAWNESNNAGSPTRAAELFESAANEFNGIDNEMFRRNALNGLAAAKNSPFTDRKPAPTISTHPSPAQS